MKKLFLTFFMVLLYNFGTANERESALVPTATISGNATVCQNASSPVITFTGSGGTAPYTFTYTLNGILQPTITTVGTDSTITVPVNTSNPGTFTYSLINIEDSSTPPESNTILSQTAVVIVNPLPDATINGTGSGTFFGGVPVFRICSNTISTFTFTNGSSTASTINTNYIINWGDGTPNYSSNNWASPLTHTYQVGLWNLVYTIQSSNGCNVTKNYIVFVGSNPAVSLGNPGNTDICNSNTLTFPITGTINNPPGTTYTVSFNDDSSPQVFNHPPPSSVTHNFLISSCGVTSSSGTTSFNNSFSANIVAENPCGVSAIGVVPIYVSTPPIANFTLPIKSCTNTPVCLTNTSSGANENNGSSTNCNTSPKFVWTISPNAGYTVSSGSLGNDFGSTDPSIWTTGTSPLCINFTQAGIYTITLKVGNRCGVETKVKTICIEPPLVPQFTLSNISGCVPMAVNTTNNTNLVNQCSTPTSTWSVTYASGNCGTSSAYTYTGGTSATSASPSFNFTEAGTYTITLTTSNSCTPSQSTSQTVVVKKPPTVAINSINNLCQTDISTIINPTANINSCAPASSTLTYAWSFPGGNPASSNLANPGPITYSTFGTYTVSLSVTNECGTTVATNKTFTINPSPTITGALFTCIGNTSQLGGSPTAATGTAWVSSNPSIATVSNTGLVTGISVGVTNITYTNSNGCQKTVVFTVNPLPTITGNLNVCVASTTQLTGSATAASTNAWTSSNTSVATVNNSGFVTGIAIGTTIITYTNSNGCQITATVTVNPLPTITGILNVCVGSTRQLTGSAIAASTNAWTSSNTSVATVNNSGFVTGISAGNAIITYTNSNGCQITTTVTVNALPTITGTLITCAGSTTQLTGSATAATTNAWTSSNISVATVNNSGLVTGVSAGNVIITYINSNGCQITATLTVNPSPVVTFSPSNQTICSENTSTLVTLSSTTSGATFSWTASQPTGITGVITSGTNTIPSQNLVNSTNAPITINYVAVAATNGTSTCAGSTFSYTITVNPRPSITENFAEAICSGESFSITPSNSTLNSIPTGTTYSWSAPIVTGGITGGTSATNQTSISGTLVNPTNIVQTATYTVTPRANGCAGNTFTVVISVNPKPVIANVTHPAICSENAFTVTPTNGSGNIVPTGTTYTWTISNNSNITGASASSTPGITTISQTLTNTTNTAQTIVYTVTPTSGDVGNCVGSTFTITVVVNPKPLVQATTQAICSATAFTVTPTNGSGNIVPNTTTYTWTTPVSTPAGAITGGSAQTTGVNTISQTLTNTTTEVATIEYTVTPMSGACAGIPFIITITVNPTPTTLSLTNQTYCNGVSTTEIAFTNVVAGTTYTWTNSNTSIGLAASGTGNIPVFTPTNGGTAPIIANISVIATANGCSRVAETFTITVNPSPVVTFSPTNQTICSGETSALVNLSSTTPGATFSWTATQPTGITGVATSGTNTIPAQNLVNSTNAPITITYVAVAATTGGNTCAGSTYNYTITVNPKPSITENFAEAICSGESFSITPSNSTLNSIPTGTTYSWSAPIVTGGITGGTSATNQTSISGTLVNPTNIVQTATYTVTPRANGCAGNTFTVVISVNPKPVIANVTHPAICSENAFTVTPTNGSGNIVPTGTTYTWTISNNSNITGASASSTPGITTISQTLTNTTNTAQTIVYTVTPTSGDVGNCVGSTFTITVVVNPKPLVQATTQAICSATAFTVTPTNGSGNIVPNTTTYTWTTPVSTPAGAITGGSAQTTGVNTISQTLTNTTTEVATIEYTVTPMAGACAGIPFIITITVNPTPTTLSLTNQTYCNGVSTTEIAFTNVVAGTTYTWTNSNTSIGLAASGTGNIPVFTPTNGGTAPIIANISVIATANGCSRVAETFTITVNPSPVVTFSPTNQTICSGETSALVNLSSTTPGATFSWTATQPTGITGVATSGTNTIPAQNLVNSTNAPITITYVAVAATTGGNTCAGSTYNYTITVNPKPSITENFAEAICSGESFSITPSNSTLNSIPTGTTYSWSAPIVTGGITGGTSATNQTSISGTLVNPTNIVQTATYTVTPRANGCAGNTFTVVISVNPKPVIANVTHPAICSETAFTITPANGTGNIVPAGTTYTWTVNNNTNITGASDSNVAGISTISQTLTNSSNTAQTIVYTVTPTSGDTGNCVGDTFTITVVVNPKPFIQNSTQTICSGTAFDATPTNGSGNIVPNTTTYTWTTPVSTPAGAITGGSAQTTGVNTISQTLTNTTTEVATIEYTVTPMAGACAGIPFIITITVNPTPTTLNLTNQTYCNGVSTTEIAFTNVVAGTTYTWTNSNTSIGLAASGTGNIPVFTPTNGGTAPIIANISVIATANGCSRVAETFTITVNPSPVVTFSPTNQTICSGETSALVNLSSTTPGATFSWTATQPTGITGVATSGTNTIPAQTLVNTTNAPIDVNYTAVAATNDTSACAGSSFTYTITVNPKPSIENQSFIICSEEGFTVDPIDGIPNTNTIVPLGTTYNWVISNNPNISGASSGTGSQISQVLTNNSTLIQTIVYTVTPIAGICTGNPFTITIEVYPRPDVTFDLPNQTICNETNTSLVTLNSTLPGNITYEWNATIPTGITGALSSGTNTIPVQTLINTTNAPLTITYAATATFNNNGSSCEGNVYNYSITVNPTFTSSGVVSNYNGYNVSVFGGNDGAINLTTIGGSGTYTYNWTGPNGFTSTAEDISGLFAGTYTVTINDGYCAPIVLTFTLTQPPELLIQSDLSLTINLICFGDNNGAVGVLITQESVPPYDYELYDSNGNLVTSIIDSTNLNPQFTGLVAGVYSLTVIDANGGRKTVTGLTVTQPDDIIITATTTPITCYGANNASITLTVTGGTGPYQAQWDNLATGFYQNNLAAGNYSILVTDNNGCTKTIVVNIPEAPIFTINPVVVNISCFGANDGSINLNLVGGIQPISLTWSDGSTAGLVRNNLAAGTYTVTIVDSKPCTIVRTFIIVEPQPLVLSANVQNALDCNNANSGSINLLVSGGTPPFTYSWSNGATTEDLNTISSGNYAVLVTDSRGCTKSAQYSVNRPQPLTLNVETDTNVNCETRDIRQIFEAQVSGGVPPIQLSWSSGTVSGANNEFMTTDQDGLVVLTATDALGCTTTYSLNVDIPVLGNASFDQNSYGYTAYGIYSILDPIQFTNTATGDYVSILWNFGDGTFSNEENPIHTYVLEGNYVVTQTVTYPFGCVYVHTISLLVEKGYLLVVPTAFTPNNDALNDTYRPVTKGLKNVRMDVYDTWGSLIYSETGDVLRGWDGTIKGVNAENGNYHCKVSAETFYGSIIRAEETFVLIK